MRNFGKATVVGLLALGLAACGGGGGPSELEVTQHVRGDLERDGYTLSALTNIKCRSERGSADLYTCTFKIKYGTGELQKHSACFRYDGRRWQGSGVGRNCHVFG